MKHLSVCLLMAIVAAIAPVSLCKAQGDVEYRMEIGAGVGLMAYQGDLNGKLFKNMQPAASVVLRRNIDVYRTVKFALGYGKIKGGMSGVKTYYPDLAPIPQYEFSRGIYDLNATYEYNFWPYGTGKEYRGAKRFTPFLFIGLGMIVASGEKTITTTNMPLGFGVKYKLGDRINVGAEWAMHFTANDNLDTADDPYGIVSSGLFKNTDCYSNLQLTLTYSFSAKCKTCHNADE